MPDNVDLRTSLAFNNDSVLVTDFGELASAKGVPLALDKGAHHAVIMFPSQCCDHHANRAIHPTWEVDSGHFHSFFDTSEHIAIVQGCHLQMQNGRLDAANTQLPLSEKQDFTLTYGQVIGLSGDFYGDPDQPVCEAGNREQQIKKFFNNFLSLAKSPAEAKAILRIAQKWEFIPIAEAVGKGHSPSGVYAGLPTSTGHLVPDEDRAFDEATGGTWKTNGRYLNLAFSNLDHFGLDAVACYTAGHILAQREAVQAQRNSSTADLHLKIAYAINAFADHFMTDLFSAGHMRTPRRALFASALTYPTRAAAGLCAKQMHDEDSKFGLWVENRLGDKWVAYGDARYRDWCNAANRRVLKAAVQKSMDEVWQAYQTGTVRGDDSEVLAYLPKLIWEIGGQQTATRHRDDRKNWAPLFWYDPKTRNVNRRNDISNPADRSYCEQGIWPSNWGLTTTTAQFGSTLMPKVEYAKAGWAYPPNEAGPSGEIGWPAGPTTIAGTRRVMLGATGPTLHAMQPNDWRVDGSLGPTGNF